MRSRWSWLGIILISTSLSALAQMANAAGQVNNPKKKCTPPRPVYSEQPDLSDHPSTDFGTTTTIMVSVNEKGRVTDAKIKRSSASEEYQRRALAAVRQWKFKPGVCDGEPSAMGVPVQFQINYPQRF